MSTPFSPSLVTRMMGGPSPCPPVSPLCPPARRSAGCSGSFTVRPPPSYTAVSLTPRGCSRPYSRVPSEVSSRNCGWTDASQTRPRSPPSEHNCSLLLVEGKGALLTLSLFGNKSIEDAERLCFAFVLYCTAKLKGMKDESSEDQLEVG